MHKLTYICVVFRNVINYLEMWFYDAGFDHIDLFFFFFPYFWMVRKLELKEKLVIDAEKSYLNTMKKNQHEENLTNV